MIKYQQKFLLITLILLFASTQVFAQDQSIKDRQDELAKIEADINNLNKRIADLRTRESSTIGNIEEKRSQKEVHKAEIRRLEILLLQTKEEISSYEKDIAINQAELKVLNEKVGAILRKLFMRGRFNEFKSIIKIQNSLEVGLAQAYLRYLARADYEIVKDFQARMEKLRNDKNQLTRKQKQHNNMLESESDHLLAADKAAAEQDKILRDIRNDRRVQQISLQQSIEARERLKSLITELERQPKTEERIKNTENLTFSSKRGKLPWPVKGEVTAKFGKIRDAMHNTEIDNDGIDIKATTGTKVISVASATVAFADWHDAGGNMVVLDHGKGYYTLYAHLSRFSVAAGDNVQAGTTIGEVGETASLKGQLLHFEIRKVESGRGQEALDPLRWLQK